MASTFSQKRRRRLVRQLQTALQSLHVWEATLRVAAVQAPSHPTSEPSPAAVLLAIVAEAKQGVELRLNEMGVTELTQIDTLPKSRTQSTRVSRKRDEAVSSLRNCINACRSCGRVLGAAFREAQSVADAASARILYGSIRAFEKQLWVLDPNQAY